MEITGSKPSVRQLRSCLNKPSTSSVRHGGYSKTQERAYSLYALFYTLMYTRGLLFRGRWHGEGYNCTFPGAIANNCGGTRALAAAATNALEFDGRAKQSREQREIAQLCAYPYLQSLLVAQYTNRSAFPTERLHFTRSERLLPRPSLPEKAPRTDRNTTAVETSSLPPPLPHEHDDDIWAERSFVAAFVADDECVEGEEPAVKRCRY